MIGLKCDHCGNTEMVDRVSAQYIGKACAVCGANMLTKEDYDGAIKMMEAIKAMEAIGLVKMAENLNEPNVVRVGFHDGEFTLKHALDG